MPIYKYRCDECEAVEEVFGKMSDPPPAECASCGARDTMHKQVARTAFRLKGGGWYAEGYASARAGETKSTNGDSGGESKSGDAGSSSSSDSASSSESKSSGSSAKSDAA